MKKSLIFGLSLLLFVPFISGCSKNNGGDDKAYIAMATVERENGLFLLRTDEGPVVRPVNLNANVNSGQRIIMIFEQGKQYPSGSDYDFDVSILNFNWVLTKNIVDLTSSNADIIGDDPFYGVADINTDGGYMNVSFYFLFNVLPHRINLVVNTLTDPAYENEDIVELELRQNANGDNYGIPVYGIASFPLDKYIEDARQKGKESVSFVVKVETLGGERTYKTSYKLNGNNYKGMDFEDGLYDGISDME